MKQLGYGDNYKYAHDYPGHFVKQQFLPDELKDRESFSIRLRATRQRNASDTENTASGTSRIGVVRMSCLDL